MYIPSRTLSEVTTPSCGAMILIFSDAVPLFARALISEGIMPNADSFSLAWAKANPQKLDPAKVLALPRPEAVEKDP